jgi:hypothetical protein
MSDIASQQLQPKPRGRPLLLICGNADGDVHNEAVRR